MAYVFMQGGFLLCNGCTMAAPSHRLLVVVVTGLRSSWAIGDLSHTKDTGMCSGDGRPSTADKQQPESDAVGYSSSQLRRSMRLLDCYLVRGSPGENSTRPLADAGSTSQLQQTNLSAKQQHLQPQWQRIRQQRQQPGRQFSNASILEQAAIQQHQQQEVAAGDAMQQQQLKSGQHSGSRLNPARQQQTEEAQIALQMQKLQVWNLRDSPWVCMNPALYIRTYTLYRTSANC